MSFTLSLPSKYSSWWRRLEDVLKTSFVFVFRRRLQDLLLKTNIFTEALPLQKTSYDVLRPKYSSWLQVFKTSLKLFQDVLPRCLQDVFMTSWRRLQDILSRRLQDVFKTYHQVKLFLLTCLQKVFYTFLSRSFPKTVFYRGICVGNTTSEKFLISVQNLQER